VRVPVLLNGSQASLEARTDDPLLTALRQHGLRSVRPSCEIGICGACTVLLDGQPVSSCLLLAPAAAGHAIETMEGVSADDPVAAAFMRHAAFQCGYCSPGFILTARALLAETPHPREAEIKAALGGNLCRCGSYRKIVAAVTDAAGT